MCSRTIAQHSLRWRASQNHTMTCYGGTFGTAKKLLTVEPPQCSYGLPPRYFWTCEFTLSVAHRDMLWQADSWVVPFHCETLPRPHAELIQQSGARMRAPAQSRARCIVLERDTWVVYCSMRRKSGRSLIVFKWREVCTIRMSSARRATRLAPPPSPHSVPGLPHVILMEWRQALVSYQDNHMSS